MFNNIYKGKVVLITGHTGFKGTWLTSWLINLGAEVVGYSIGHPSVPNHFEEIALKDKIHHYYGDVLDFDHLKNVCDKHKPQVVFHLAAQALVRLSYNNPRETVLTNVIGVTNILEIARITDYMQALVIITSDKCYENVEWTYGYRENDQIGGEDPYSGSKGAAELIAHSFMRSFFSSERVFISTVRAGNVIGGGDWAKDRIVPDSVRAWSKCKEVVIRSPYSTRPWQHVLEPLSGYLQVAVELLKKNNAIKNQSYNFGPDSHVNKTVEQLLNEMSKSWSSVRWKMDLNTTKQKEAGLLKLCCDKSHHMLDWYPTLSFEETVKFTVLWYRYYYQNKPNNQELYQYTLSQIDDYVKIAKSKKIRWTL